MDSSGSRMSWTTIGEVRNAPRFHMWIIYGIIIYYAGLMFHFLTEEKSKLRNLEILGPLGVLITLTSILIEFLS